MEGGAAGDDDDLVDLAEHVRRDAHLVQGQRARPVDAAQQGVGDRLRLLGDLLEHEVVVAALLGGGGVPVDVVLPDVGGRPVEVRHRHRVPAQLDHLVLAQLDRLTGVGDERGDIRGEERLPRPDPHHQGVAPRTHHHIRLIGVHGHQREGALQPPRHQPHRLGEVGAGGVLLGEEVGDDLGVGLGGQFVPAFGQLLAQGGEVLDDAVVDDGDPARVVHVRVGVGVGGPAVGGPPGVPDRGRPGRAGADRPAPSPG